jgi:uncharacterized protein (DUF1697 family)
VGALRRCRSRAFGYLNMPRYVALFRGINVGKAKRIAMADLRSLLGKLGYTAVSTLLNSGNAIFTAGPGNAAGHATRIRTAVAKQLGVDAVVVVKSAREVAGIMAGNELGKVAGDPARLLVALTDDVAVLAGLKSVAARPWGTEKLHVGKHAAYVWCANGILESEVLTAVMKALAGAGTTRNWATLGKIHDLLQKTDGS